jgi:hypothetical protein
MWTTLPCHMAGSKLVSFSHRDMQKGTMTRFLSIGSREHDDDDKEDELTPEQAEQELSTTSDENRATGTDSTWLEGWALEGARTIAHLDIHERTQRSMLAEKVEDRIYELTIALENLVDEATGTITDEDLPKAKEIAEETRSLQVEYRDLVTGAPSRMLNAVASLKATE